jgi:hypothetical protein
MGNDRGRAARLVAVALIGCAVGILASASAVAATPPPPGVFAVKASNGYAIDVLGSEARKGHPASVLVVAKRGDDEALYSAPATVTEESIQADLGELGEIAVTFHRSGQAKVVRSRCGRPRAAQVDAGFYEGTIEFHGEQGYTDVEATSAPGDVRFLLGLLCPGPSGRTGRNLPGAELDVQSASPFDPSLSVTKNRPGAPAHFEVGVLEKREGIVISRFAGLVAPARSFQYDTKAQTAAVKPPAPFSGSGTFRHTANPASRWSGNLTVDLPGRSDVLLTGFPQRSRLIPAHWSW